MLQYLHTHQVASAGRPAVDVALWWLHICSLHSHMCQLTGRHIACLGPSVSSPAWQGRHGGRMPSGHWPANALLFSGMALIELARCSGTHSSCRRVLQELALPQTGEQGAACRHAPGSSCAAAGQCCTKCGAQGAQSAAWASLNRAGAAKHARSRSAAQPKYARHSSLTRRDIERQRDITSPQQLSSRLTGPIVRAPSCLTYGEHRSRGRGQPTKPGVF